MAKVRLSSAWSTVVFAPDVTEDFFAEVNFIAKSLGIPTKSIRISDHPCGEYTIFIRRDGEEVWGGYIDVDFYDLMDSGAAYSLRQGHEAHQERLE